MPQAFCPLLDSVFDRQDTIDAVLRDGTNALDRLRKAAPVIDSATAAELAIELRGCAMQMQRVVNSLEQAPRHRGIKASSNPNP